MKDCASNHSEEDINTRAAEYGLFSRIFRVEADQALIDSLCAMDAVVKDDEAATTPGYAALRAYLADIGSETLLDLARDYARVFCGASSTNRQFACPYESAYTSADGLLMQEARDEVLALYKAAELRMDPGWSDPEDHIAAELEFMAHLCSRTAAAVHERDECLESRLWRQQREFFEEHLASWAPRFLADVKCYAREGFYRAFSEMTTAFLEGEREYLEEKILMRVDYPQ